MAICNQKLIIISFLKDRIVSLHPPGSSNGTEKVERYMKSLKAGARMNLTTAGFTDKLYFDAFHVFGHDYKLLPTDANRCNPREAPFQSLGLKVPLGNMKIFGSLGRILVKGHVPTAKEFLGEPCLFIGYGTDSQGYRVILPRESRADYVVDKDVAIQSSLTATRAFIQECRVNDSLAPWVDEVFMPNNVLDACLAVDASPGDAGGVSAPVKTTGGDDVKNDELSCGFTEADMKYLGTKVIKQFDDKDGNLLDFKGLVTSINRNEDDNSVIYGILYSDGDKRRYVPVRAAVTYPIEIEAV